MVQNSEHSSLDIYLKQISIVPLITVEEEIELAKRISKGDDQARDKMITANLRLVVKIAQDYSRYRDIGTQYQLWLSHHF